MSARRRVAGDSVRTAEHAGTLLEEIVPSIGKTSNLVQEIAAASAEQTAGVVQIGQAMSQMNQLTQQNASSSEELAATAEEMMGQTTNLQQLMRFFKLSDKGSRHDERPGATPALVTAKVPARKSCTCIFTFWPGVRLAGPQAERNPKFYSAP